MCLLFPSVSQFLTLQQTSQSIRYTFSNLKCEAMRFYSSTHTHKLIQWLQTKREWSNSLCRTCIYCCSWDMCWRNCALHYATRMTQVNRRTKQIIMNKSAKLSLFFITQINFLVYFIANNLKNKINLNHHILNSLFHIICRIVSSLNLARRRQYKPILFVSKFKLNDTQFESHRKLMLGW